MIGFFRWKRGARAGQGGPDTRDFSGVRRAGPLSQDRADAVLIGGEIGLSDDADIADSLRRQPVDLSHDPFARFDLPQDVPADLVNPHREALRYDGAKVLLASHRAEIDRIYSAFSHRHLLPRFDDLYADLLWNFASLVGMLPASRAHHHARRGGLFTHSLDVAHKSLHLSTSYNVTLDSSPRNRDADSLAWQLTAFIGGLIHDIGKVHSLGHVHAMAVRSQPAKNGAFRSSAAPAHKLVWMPAVCSMEEWAQSYRVESYYIDYSDVVARPHALYAERYFMRVVPEAIRAFIWSSNPVVVSMLEDFLPNPDKNSSTLPLFRLVKDADTMSVSENVDPHTVPGISSLSALITRRFLEFAARSSWNLPSSPFLRAHVQIEAPDRFRYIQLPFFVAQPEHIASFCDYVLREPTFGHSLSRETIETVVFASLEGAGVLVRTAPTVLGEQLPVPDYPEYIPASEAHVLFVPPSQMRPVAGANAASPIGKDTTPQEMELPLIPIGAALTIARREHMPTVSFRSDPQVAPEESLAVRIDEGRLKPEDSQLDRDPEMAERLRTIEEAVNTVQPSDRSEARAIAEVATSPVIQKAKKKPYTPRKGSNPFEGSGGGGASWAGQGAERQGAMEFTAPEADNPSRTEEPSQADKPKAAVSRFDDAPEKTVPVWVQVYRMIPDPATMFDDDEDLPMTAEQLERRRDMENRFWAVVYLWLSSETTAIPLLRVADDGCHMIHVDAFTLTIRSAFSRAINHAGLKVGALSEFWDKLGFRQPAAMEAFTESPENRAFLRMNPAINRIINSGALESHVDNKL